MVTSEIDPTPGPSGIGRRSTALVVCLSVCLLAVACSDARHSAVSGSLLRFIETAPQEIFEITEISTETVVADLTPRRGAKIGGWELTGPADVGGFRDERLLVKMKEDGEAVFTRELREPAAEIHVIEIEVGGLRPSDSVRLLWAEEGQAFNKGRSIRFGARNGVGTMFRTFRFDVGRHVLWSDRVAKLELRVTGQNLIHIGRVLAIHLEIDDERFREAAAGSWLYELDGHHRGMLLAVPGEVIERRVRLQPGAELRFGVGVPPTQPDGVRFRVTLLDVESGRSDAIFDQRTAGGSYGWFDHVVDLSAFAGREVRLALEVEEGDSFDVLFGVPMWAEPEVRAPTTDDMPPNVVLISVDTLRADRMSLYGSDRLTTRRIERWAERRAVVFDNAVAASPWTLPSHTSMLTGLDAVAHGVNHPAPAPTTLLTLAEMLRSRGYATAAVTGGSYLHPRFGLAQGFDSYRSFKGDLALELETEIKTALGWLDAHASQTPFFLFFHTYEVHDPYDPREPYFSEYAGAPLDPAYKDAVTRNAGDLRDDRLRNTNRFDLRSAEGNDLTKVRWEDVGVIADLYDSGVAYADEKLGLLLDRLVEPDLRDTTLVILTSDHGEALGEHRLAGHSSLYDHDLLIPLLVALPDGKQRGNRVAAQVRTVDIAPTVLEIAGLPRPPGMDGRSLLPMITGEERFPRRAESYAALSNHGLSLRTGDGGKYIFRNIPWEIPIGWEQYFDLASDPGETRNLSGGSVDLQPLRNAAVETLESRQPGLRLVLSNRSDRGCRIELAGDGVTIGASTVKSTSMDGGCRMLGLGRVGCDVEPGIDVNLVFERVQSSVVEIAGTFTTAAANASPFELAIEIGADPGPRSVSFDPVGGVSDGPAGDGSVSVMASWFGDPGLLGLDPADTDMELRRQLEALGYIR